jgi:hypothetical protein
MLKSSNHRITSVEDKIINQVFIPKPKGYFALFYHTTSNSSTEDKQLQLLTKFLDPEIYSLINSFAKNFASIRSKIFVLQLETEDLNDYLTNFSLPPNLLQRNSQAIKNCDDDIEKSELYNSIISKEKTKISARIDNLRSEISDIELLKF